VQCDRAGKEEQGRRPGLRLKNEDRQCPKQVDVARQRSPAPVPGAFSRLLVGGLYDYGQPVGYLAALIVLTFGLFGLLGHRVGNFRPLRWAALAIFLTGTVSSLVFVFVYGSLLSALLCLVAAAIAVTILFFWLQELVAAPPATDRFYLWVVAVVVGVLGLYADLASIK
jgi:hypothetical protein